jgi:hypothetical protein
MSRLPTTHCPLPTAHCPAALEDSQIEEFVTECFPYEEEPALSCPALHLPPSVSLARPGCIIGRCGWSPPRVRLGPASTSCWLHRPHNPSHRLIPRLVATTTHSALRRSSHTNPGEHSPSFCSTTAAVVPVSPQLPFSFVHLSSPSIVAQMDTLIASTSAH